MKNHILQRRRYYFLLTILVPCLCLFLILPWPAALTLLVLLAIFLAGAVEELWKLFQRWPIPPQPTPQSSPEEEYSSYDQGLQPVTYYQPPMPKEAPITEDVPAAQYPEMQQYR